MALKLLATGTLEEDAETKTSGKGALFCRFRLACDYSFGGDTRVERINCVAFGKLAEQAGGLRKGNAVSIEARPSTSSYEKNGVKQWSTSFVIDKLTITDNEDAPF